jgi:hypothetical protein
MIDTRSWARAGPSLHIAFKPFVKAFLQLGHMRDACWCWFGWPSGFSSVKCTSTKVLSEYSCRVSLVDPGQIGDSFRFFFERAASFSVMGVKEGTQKEWRADFASDYNLFSTYT